MYMLHLLMLQPIYDKSVEYYREDLAAIAAAGGAEFVVGTQTTYTAAWTGNASFQELRDAQTPEEAASALETAEYQIIQ